MSAAAISVHAGKRQFLGGVFWDVGDRHTDAARELYLRSKITTHEMNFPRVAVRLHPSQDKRGADRGAGKTPTNKIRPATDTRFTAGMVLRHAGGTFAIGTSPAFTKGQRSYAKIDAFGRGATVRYPWQIAIFTISSAF
jgi:hypothetical protein